MRQWIIALLVVLFVAPSFAQQKTSNTTSPSTTVAAKGTLFQTGTLKSLLAKAAKEKKYLFVDVYASWCGPCKTMATRIFPQQKMGDYFNKTFVNAKFDAEKGEGIEIAKKYEVEAYPTFLILDSEGTEVGRIVGGGEADLFIQKVQQVVANIDKEEK